MRDLRATGAGPQVAGRFATPLQARASIDRRTAAGRARKQKRGRVEEREARGAAQDRVE